MNRNENKPAHPNSGTADWMALAAAPTFAIMALLTSSFGDPPPNILCTSVHGISCLCGMPPMYLLMSAFHSAPWLKLIARLGSSQPQNKLGSGA
jgi:hypothetical protein